MKFCAKLYWRMFSVIFLLSFAWLILILPEPTFVERLISTTISALLFANMFAFTSVVIQIIGISRATSHITEKMFRPHQTRKLRIHTSPREAFDLCFAFLNTLKTKFLQVDREQGILEARGRYRWLGWGWPPLITFRIHESGNNVTTIEVSCKPHPPKWSRYISDLFLSPLGLDLESITIDGSWCLRTANKVVDYLVMHGNAVVVNDHTNDGVPLDSINKRSLIKGGIIGCVTTILPSIFIFVSLAVYSGAVLSPKVLMDVSYSSLVKTGEESSLVLDIQNLGNSSQLIERIVIDDLLEPEYGVSVTQTDPKLLSLRLLGSKHFLYAKVIEPGSTQIVRFYLVGSKPGRLGGTVRLSGSSITLEESISLIVTNE